MAIKADEEFAFYLPGECGGEMKDPHFPDPYMLVHYADYKERILWIEGEITDDLTVITRNILKWNREDHDRMVPVSDRIPIRLMINSYGGNLDQAMTLIDVMAMSDTPVYTYNMGNALSAALIILVAGHKRYTMPNATAMNHELSMTTKGKASDVTSSVKNAEWMDARCNDLIVARTNIDMKTLKRKSQSDWYIHADEMLKYGFVDEILDTPEKLAQAME